jgi:hypothetical protein
MPEPALAVHVAGAGLRARHPAARRLHVLNGDTAAEGLRAAGVVEAMTLAADLLYEGPVTDGSSPERARRVRARFLAESGYGGYEECLARLTGWDRELEAFRTYDEVVLWFEHDLFDQLQLCRLLSWFAGRGSGLTEISLVQAGDYLGRMAPHRMAELLEERQPVSEAQARLAGATWRAFCAATPVGLEALVGFGADALPHLGAALRRHLEEFPGVGDGLSRTERQILEAAAAGAGSVAGGALFARVQAMEERVFMTDLSVLRRLRGLASGPRPLLRLDPAAGGTARWPAAEITPAGLGVLAGRDDWVEMRGGLDLWLGGVHLTGRTAAWRWDRREGRLAAAPSWNPWR